MSPFVGPPKCKVCGNPVSIASDLCACWPKNRQFGGLEFGVVAAYKDPWSAPMITVTGDRTRGLLLVRDAEQLTDNLKRALAWVEKHGVEKWGR